jgi:hypothetical protein
MPVSLPPAVARLVNHGNPICDACGKATVAGPHTSPGNTVRSEMTGRLPKWHAGRENVGLYSLGKGPQEGERLPQAPYMSSYSLSLRYRVDTPMASWRAAA